MKHLVLESNLNSQSLIKIFIPFGLLQDILIKGFPDPMAESIEMGLIKDNETVMGVLGEVRITIDRNKLKGIRGNQTVGSLLLVEISDKVVQNEQDISKLEQLTANLKATFPHINFSISSTWSSELLNKDVPQELQGVFLEKDKWYLTQEAIDFIRGFEGGVRLEPFWDSKHWAIGYGHMLTSKYQMGNSITKERAEELFKEDLKRFEQGVKDAIKVPMTLEMYAACVAFAYNAGRTGFGKSETASLINQKKYKEASERWKTEKINLGTIYERGLRKRREKEVAYFLKNSTNNVA
jgi:lysozyme